MNTPVFINGKANLDTCYFCGETQEKIRYSQSILKKPIQCVYVWNQFTGYEPAHHKFSISRERWDNDHRQSIGKVNNRQQSNKVVM